MTPVASYVTVFIDVSPKRQLCAPSSASLDLDLARCVCHCTRRLIGTPPHTRLAYVRMLPTRTFPHPSSVLGCACPTTHPIRVPHASHTPFTCLSTPRTYTFAHLRTFSKSIFTHRTYRVLPHVSADSLLWAARVVPLTPTLIDAMLPPSSRLRTHPSLAYRLYCPLSVAPLGFECSMCVARVRGRSRLRTLFHCHALAA